MICHGSCRKYNGGCGGYVGNFEGYGKDCRRYVEVKRLEFKIELVL
jgi:hypothetical protein